MIFNNILIVIKDNNSKTQKMEKKSEISKKAHYSEAHLFSRSFKFNYLLK